MDLEFYKVKNPRGGRTIFAVCGTVKGLFKNEEKPVYDKEMDEKSNRNVVKKQLRCAISSCFDKQDICCKECDIKNCRYKCNFIDKEVCEHQIT
ncbi:MAG: hypothetical protein VB106_06505 [Clostridiaceae bacterium]|nr:hypothetical protein [Clostridiaceae bacterium]